MRSSHLSHPVIYSRGSESVEVGASVGRTVFQTVSSAGLLEVTEARDFLIAAADLVLEGQRTLPQAGDRVSESCGPDTFIYMVLAPEGEPVWRYSDPYRQTLRVHTKQVGPEELP